MAEAIRMPLLSDTMKEGIIAEWHKKVGDTVKSDDVIADVETDKATMEVTPYVDGTLLYIAAEKGEGVPVNGIICIIGKPDEDFSSILANEHVATDVPATVTAAPSVTPIIANPETPIIADTIKRLPTDATVLRMPLLSDTMTEGKIVAWHKHVGDTVKSDDVIADVETDKATMEVTPYVDGTILYLGVKEGEAAKINDIIAIIGKPGTDITPFLLSPTPVATTATPSVTVSQPAPKPALAAPIPEEVTHEHDERIKASPLAKRLAKDKGVDIHDVVGSGDNGRIVKRDIDNYLPASVSAPIAATISRPVTALQPTTASSAQPVSTGQYTDIPLTQMRKIIAQKLSESKHTAPHFYLRMTITMDQAIEARKAINAVSLVKVSFNDLIIKVCAMALRKHPEVNSSWKGEFIRQNHDINIGTAVALDTGLIVPVIHHADEKSLSQIAEEATSLIEKARSKKIVPQEFTGNTFSISNLGMMDIDEFTAIINPPDSCILAVGKITLTPVVENNAVVVKQLMKVTLSCDHRVVDGAVGSRFLQTVKAYLENPVTMLI